MHIVMIGPFGLRPRGTMAVRALPLARALVTRQHQVTMLLPPWQNPEDAGRSWEDEGVHIENLSLPAGIPGWFHWRLTRALLRRTLSLSPDIVHAFKPKAYAGLVHWGLTYRIKGQRIPVVVDEDDWEGPGGWNTLSAYSPLLKRFFTWQERWGLTHAATVTVASRALQTLVWATGRVPESVFYLPNGFIPRANPNKQAHQARSPRPTLLLYTRFFEFEVSRLWEILQGVRAQRPDIKLLVIGKGFFGEEEQLIAMAREANWTVSQTPSDESKTDLTYAGYVAAEELPTYFARADVALYPFDDTLINRTKCPVKLMDLLAAGVPVVGDGVGQIKETIRDGQTGLLTSPGHTSEFIDNVVNLLNDDQRRHQMAQRAADDIRTRLSWKQLASSAEAAYRYARRHK